MFSIVSCESQSIIGVLWARGVAWHACRNILDSVMLSMPCVKRWNITLYSTLELSLPMENWGSSGFSEARSVSLVGRWSSTSSTSSHYVSGVLATTCLVLMSSSQGNLIVVIAILKVLLRRSLLPKPEQLAAMRSI